MQGGGGGDEQQAGPVGAAGMGHSGAPGGRVGDASGRRGSTLDAPCLGYGPAGWGCLDWVQVYPDTPDRSRGVSG